MRNTGLCNLRKCKIRIETNDHCEIYVDCNVVNLFYSCICDNLSWLWSQSVAYSKECRNNRSPAQLSIGESWLDHSTKQSVSMKEVTNTCYKQTGLFTVKYWTLVP